MSQRLELVCPAGTPAALHAAVDNGADAVYLGFRDETNARNFPGLNFSRKELAAGLEYAHARGSKVFLAINTFAEAGNPGPWRTAIDDAWNLGVDCVILADIGLCAYTADTYPDLRRHLSVQASASNPEAIRFYQDAFGIQRVVLPRVLTLHEIAELNNAVTVETEVFVFGGLCVMAEGRCQLSSYATGQSPNINGVCSPASEVEYLDKNGQMVSRLGGLTINAFAKGEAAGYPTLCKGRFQVDGKVSYLFEDPTSLDAMMMMPELAAAGVTALKIEGRQRGRAYVAKVVKAFRETADAVAQSRTPTIANLDGLSEGRSQTQGAYDKGWR